MEDVKSPKVPNQENKRDVAVIQNHNYKLESQIQQMCEQEHYRDETTLSYCVIRGVSL